MKLGGSTGRYNPLNLNSELMRITGAQINFPLADRRVIQLQIGSSTLAPESSTPDSE